MNRSLAWLVGILLLASFILIAYRVFALGYAFIPSTNERVWQLSSEGFVEPTKEDVRVCIAYPADRPGQTVIEQEFTSGKLDFDLIADGANKFGEWSGRPGSAGVGIGYRVNIVNSRSAGIVKSKTPQLGPFPAWAGTSEQQLAERLVKPLLILEPSRRFHAIVNVPTDQWWEPRPVQPDIDAWKAIKDQRGIESAVLLLARAAGLPALRIEGLKFEEKVTSSLLSWIEVWTGLRWECFVPSQGGAVVTDRNLLPLVIGENQAVKIENGEMSEVRWVLSYSGISNWQNHYERIRWSNNPLDMWSLFHLPQEFQNTFRILILVPLGALLIGVLRNVVGLPVFGIFMPVLMALAFRNTGLAYGLGLFGGIILIGFLARRWINRLRLLLVPRLSLILTLVIMCIIVVALIGNKLGYRQMMAVGLLPFVILTMTIERFFVIAEEAGVWEGFKTALGSAVVACITYLIINNEALQLVFFIYPELLLVVAAIQVMLGRYTGYRLIEFYRFRNLRPGIES